MANASAADMWLGQPESLGAAHQNYYSLVSPATHSVLANVPDVDARFAFKSVDAAEQAFETWRRVNVHERSKALLRWSSAIATNAESLAVLISLEMGKPITEARGEVASTIEAIEWAAHEAPRVWGEVISSRQPDRHSYTLHQPVGVVYGVTPWNFPLAMVARKAAPALAAGCTVILKPSEQTPLTALAMSRLWAESDLDPDAFQVLPTMDPAAVTDAILSHTAVRKITFTGSTQVGQQLYEKAARGIRRVSLELGGHAPFIVYNDANLERAAEAIATTKFRNAGQACISTNRVYAHESVAHELSRILIEKAASIKVGNPLDEHVTMGPVVNSRATDRLGRQIEDAVSRGAKVAVGGTIDGLFVQPTILAGFSDDASTILHQETFGPVLPIIEFSNKQDVIALANNTPYGLAAYVWTDSLSKAHTTANGLNFGLIGINSLSTIETQAPFGGLKQSGIGYEGGEWGVKSFLEMKFVNAHYGN